MTERRWDKGSGVSGGQVRLSEKGCFSGERGGPTAVVYKSGDQSKRKKKKTVDISERNKSRSPPHDVFLIILFFSVSSSTYPLSSAYAPPPATEHIPRSRMHHCVPCMHTSTHALCPYFPSPSLLPLGRLRGPAAIAPAFATFPDHCRHSTKNLNLIGGRAANYERPPSAFTFLLDVVPPCPQQKLALMAAVKLYATGYR